MQVHLEDGSSRQFQTPLPMRRCGAWAGWLNSMQTSSANRLHFAAKRIKDGKLLIVSTNLNDGGRDLNLYRKRLEIECLFADAKTRGLNIEDIHVTDTRPCRRAVSTIPTVGSDDGCPGPLTSTNSAITTSRISLCPSTQPLESASPSERPSRPCLPSLEKTFK